MRVVTKKGLVHQTNLITDDNGNESLATWQYQEGTDLSKLENWKLLT